MLYIKKLYPLPDVVDQINRIKRSDEWKKIPEGDTVAVRALFDSIPKNSLRQTLVKEQHGLCAYCMKRIRDDDKTTIEHWTPLSKSKDKAIAYTNMLGVCHGGRKAEKGKERILCCDASKNEAEIRINPWNESHMKDIAYQSNGIIYTLSGNTEFEEDINDRLCLNGLKDRKGNQIDTSTEIVKGRRDAVQWCNDFYRILDKKEKCTSLMIKKKIDEIEQAEIQPEYAGVKLFYLRKKYRELVQREK